LVNAAKLRQQTMLTSKLLLTHFIFAFTFHPIYAKLKSKKGIKMTSWGAPQAFLDISFSMETDECIIWPYAKTGDGTAEINKNGKILRVPRIICEKIHGKPPTYRHQAAHSCGNGHLGCINWKHLSWKKPGENNIDMVLHGTLNTQKLNKNDILEIRRLYGKMTQRKIAEKFNVSLSTIESILSKKTWSYIK
jgi:hypothetical protein